MKVFPCYWTDILKINFLQRCVILHSYLYYELDDPVISDRDFDRLCKKLTEYQSKHDPEWIHGYTTYGYCMYDFDGCTGFDLWSRLRDRNKEMIKFIARGAVE